MTNLIWDFQTRRPASACKQNLDLRLASIRVLRPRHAGPCNTDAYSLRSTLSTCVVKRPIAGVCRPGEKLLSIVLNDGSHPSIDANYFPATLSSWYWTSDTYAPNPSGAWLVYFGNGNTSACDKTNTNYVRLVRSGQ